MAAGRHGRYHESEFKDHESNLEVNRRGFLNSKEYDRVWNGGHDDVRSGSRDSRDKIRMRQKDVRERETAVNGSYRSASSRSDSGSSGSLGPRRCGFSAKTIDREPGELSSESGSDGATESETGLKDCDVAVFEGNRSRSPPPQERKRKFSPIVWDQDDKEVKGSSKVRVSTTTVTALPPLPQLSKSAVLSPNSSSGEVQIRSVRNRETGDLELPAEAQVTVPSPSRLQSLSPKETLGNDQEAEQPEGEDYVPTRNISSSRWAAGDNSPVDEGEILNDEEMPKRKRRLSPELFLLCPD